MSLDKFFELKFNMSSGEEGRLKLDRQRPLHFTQPDSFFAFSVSKSYSTILIYQLRLIMKQDSSTKCFHFSTSFGRDSEIKDAGKSH